MKKVMIGLILIFSFNVYAQDFIHPLDFKEGDKEKVIKYIQIEAKKSAEALGGQNSAAMLRMMEKGELSSFKKLMKVKNRKILDEVIKTCNDIGTISYSMIYMMYRGELKASKQKLKW